MLRIIKVSANESETLCLEGILGGAWVDQLQQACAEAKACSGQVYLDLANVTFVDLAGTRLLRRLISQGLTVAGCSSFLAELLRK